MTKVLKSLILPFILQPNIYYMALLLLLLLLLYEAVRQKKLCRINLESK